VKKTVVLGITGGFGTGKTTVASMFAKLGALVLDADKMAHGVIMPGRPGYRKVISLFGADILSRNKRIDRKLLGKIVFSDPGKLKALNSVIHPEVISMMKDVIEGEGSRGRVIVLDVPLLVESGLADRVDRVIVVSAKRKKQIARCLKKWKLSKADIAKRIRSQMPLSVKRRSADFIIDNNGSLQKTRKAVENIWREIRNE